LAGDRTPDLHDQAERIDIERRPGVGLRQNPRGRVDRWRVVWRGEEIVASTRDPEHAAARALVARGVTGRMVSYVDGRRSMLWPSIEKAAGRGVVEKANGGTPRVGKWTPHPRTEKDGPDGEDIAEAAE
jgi:hypothetical protein